MKTTNFKIKTAFILCVAAIGSIMFTGCTKETLDAIAGGGSTGSIVFWSNQNGAPINVKIDGSSAGSISSYYSSTTPDCGASGCVNRSYTTGVSHSYTATDGTHNWSGTFSLSSTGCKTLLLFF